MFIYELSVCPIIIAIKNTIDKTNPIIAKWFFLDFIPNIENTIPTKENIKLIGISQNIKEIIPKEKPTFA